MAAPAFAERPAEMSRARGRSRGARPRLPAPPTTTARGESFAPTRSARTPHVAARDDPPPGDVGVVGRFWCASLTSLPRVPTALAMNRVPGRAAARLGDRAASPPSREGERAQLHPRCLPSPDVAPVGARLAFHRLSPVCGMAEQTPFRSSARPVPVTRARAAVDSVVEKNKTCIFVFLVLGGCLCGNAGHFWWVVVVA
jgi:hypothetical protein